MTQNKKAVIEKYTFADFIADIGVDAGLEDACRFLLRYFINRKKTDLLQCIKILKRIIKTRNRKSHCPTWPVAVEASNKIGAEYLLTRAECKMLAELAYTEWGIYVFIVRQKIESLLKEAA